jgi:hypothetical protein
MDVRRLKETAKLACGHEAISRDQPCVLLAFRHDRGGFGMTVAPPWSAVSAVATR